MNYDHLNDVYEDYLEHYGVKGMKWGKGKLEARMKGYTKVTDAEYDWERERQNGKNAPTTYRYKGAGGSDVYVKPAGSGYYVEDKSGWGYHAGTVDEIRGLSEKDKKDVAARRDKVVGPIIARSVVKNAAVNSLKTAKKTAKAFNRGLDILKKFSKNKKT